jgi:hypothetical protein
LQNSFTERDVLDQLDDDARMNAAFFPDFDHGYCYHVDARLSAYGDRTRWAVVIEQLHVNPRWGSFAGVGVSLSFHGNCLEFAADDRAAKHSWLTIPNILSDGPSGPLLTDSFSEQILLSTKDVAVRGHVVPIRTDENYYCARKIDTDPITNEQIDAWIENARRFLPEEVAEAKARHYEELRNRVGKFELRTWHLVRGMVPEHRELLLATEHERRHGISSDLPLLLQTSQWDHPKLMDGELPSGRESFQKIAGVLARSEVSLWNFDAEAGNVHWSNWRLSGSL